MGCRVALATKRWNWRRAFYCVAMLSGAPIGLLFGDPGRLALVVACVVFFMWYAWKRTKYQPSFLEAVAGLISPRERRSLLGLSALLVLLTVLALPAAYYYGVSGFPWHVIASGIALVACSVFAWRARRSAQVSAGPPHGDASPLTSETGTSRAPNLEH